MPYSPKTVYYCFLPPYILYPEGDPKLEEGSPIFLTLREGLYATKVPLGRSGQPRDPWLARSAESRLA